MHWAQAILFCGGLIYAAVDDLKTRTVSNIVCIIIALAGLITISPASLLGALLAMLPFRPVCGIAASRRCRFAGLGQGGEEVRCASPENGQPV